MWAPRVLSQTLKNNRTSLIDVKVAAELVEVIRIPDRSTVIEINPGYGFLTYALLKNTNVKKIIAIENHSESVTNIKKLAKEFDGRLEVLVIEKDSDVFEQLKKEKLTVHPWEEVHPSLSAIVHVPNKFPGMKMMGNYLDQFHQRTGFQSFGRVRMNLITPAYVAEKLSASIGDTKRCRTSLLREALTDFGFLKLISKDVFVPKVKDVHALCSMTPKIKSKLANVPLETYDYVVRNLLMKKRSSVRDMLGKLGAGAGDLNINLSFDSRVKVIDMTVDQFVELAYHFENWPFKPVNFDVSSIDPDFDQRKRM